MCGILALFLRFSRSYSYPITKVMKSFQILENRGPDSGSLVVRDKDIMGFRRLAIVDRSVKGEQPFYSQESRLLCNGEIYNHAELEKRHGLQCVSSSDCECILHLHDLSGFGQMLEELRGDYAIIINTGNTVYFARDPVGVRPLFYGYMKDGSFALASYARALTEFCPNVKQLLPGWGKYDLKTQKLELFPHNHTSYLVKSSVPKVEEIVRSTLTESIRLRLMTDRPLGCLLSGGLDSSLITSILCKLIGPSNVRTYSIGMKGSQDLKHARLVADYLGTNHTEVLFTPKQGFDVITDVIRDLESYDITTIRASVAMWLLAKHISSSSTDVVLLSGEGADELFCGYLYFHYAPSPDELAKESLRLVHQLYLYDVLRADRCISSHGLELRVPFLDKEMVKLCMSLSGELREPQGKIEKFLLRNSFTDGYLPKEVLWRRKDGMSDGVSGDSGKKWFEQIQEFVEDKVSDAVFMKNKNKFPSKEAYYYRLIYDDLFPTYQPKYDYWLPKWVDCGGDPSGRVLEVFNE
jgi:asparagine synthase (glutamine-hydrolysing)